MHGTQPLTFVKIHGEVYPVKANIHTVGGLSAHADSNDLIRWIGAFKTQRRVHLVHGEDEAKADLPNRLASEPGQNASVPAAGEIVEL